MTAARSRILVADPLAESGIAGLRALGNVAVEPRPDRDRFLTLLADADVLVCRSGVTVDAEALDAAPGLRVIARAGVGLDNIDLERATARDVSVFNVSGASTNAVAEHALALLLALARHVPRADAAVRSGHWPKSELTGVELRDRELGVVGLGRIGHAFARLALAVGMSVCACVSSADEGRRAGLAGEGISLVALPELLRRADVVSLHVPLTATTRHLLDREAIGAMKPGALLVNLARGGVVDDHALVDALRDGLIGGAATDVFVAEHGVPALAALPNVVLTPHIGAMSVEAQERIGRAVVAGVRQRLQR